MVETLALLLILADGPRSAGLEHWAASAIENNSKAVVITATGETHKGKFLGWSDREVVLRADEGVKAIPRACVVIVRTADSFGYHTVFAPWENLALLGFKYPVQVIRSDLSLMEGTLISVGSDHLVLRFFKEDVRIPRDKIKKVRALLKTQAELGTQIGGALGVVAILAAIAASGSGMPDGAGAETLAIGALPTAMAGRGIGSLFREYQTIYVTPRK